MAAASKNREYFGQKDLHTSGEPYDAASGATIYRGTLVLFDSSGDIVAGAHGTSGLFAGVAVRGNAESATNKIMVVNSGKFTFYKATATDADLGKMAYLSTDQDVVVAAAGLSKVYAVGRIVKIVSSNMVLIDISDRVIGLQS